MKLYRGLRVLKIVIFVLLACVVAGLVVTHLWNWLMPALFGLKTISFGQALGLLVLSKILLGGFHRHAGGHGGWKRHMQDRFANMTPEERERFRAGMKGRRGCGFGPAYEATSEQHPQ